jgi:hypothetical protein
VKKFSMRAMPANSAPDIRSGPFEALAESGRIPRLAIEFPRWDTLARPHGSDVRPFAEGALSRRFLVLVTRPHRSMMKNFLTAAFAIGFSAPGKLGAAP